MKKSIVSLLAMFVAVSMITSCGGPKEEPLAPGKKRVDLTKYGKPFTIDIPDSTVTGGPVAINEQNYMLEIRSGKNFGIIIEEGEGNIEQTKNDIKTDDVKVFKRYLNEEPEMLVWESGIPDVTQEYHIYAIVTVGNSKYVVRDASTTENEPFKEQDVKLMVEAVKSIREKKKDDA